MKVWKALRHPSKINWNVTWGFCPHPRHWKLSVESILDADYRNTTILFGPFSLDVELDWFDLNEG